MTKQTLIGGNADFGIRHLALARLVYKALQNEIWVVQLRYHY